MLLTELTEEVNVFGVAGEFGDVSPLRLYLEMVTGRDRFNGSGLTPLGVDDPDWAGETEARFTSEPPSFSFPLSFREIAPFGNTSSDAVDRRLSLDLNAGRADAEAGCRQVVDPLGLGAGDGLGDRFGDGDPLGERRGEGSGKSSLSSSSTIGDDLRLGTWLSLSLSESSAAAEDGESVKGSRSYGPNW